MDESSAERRKIVLDVIACIVAGLAAIASLHSAWSSSRAAKAAELAADTAKLQLTSAEATVRPLFRPVLSGRKTSPFVWQVNLELKNLGQVRARIDGVRLILGQLEEYEWVRRVDDVAGRVVYPGESTSIVFQDVPRVTGTTEKTVSISDDPRSTWRLTLRIDYSAPDLGNWSTSETMTVTMESD